MRINAKLLIEAVTATAEMLRFNQPADGVLSAYFRAQRTGGRERAFIAETAYAVLRRKRLIERLIGGEATPRQRVLATLVRLQGFSQRQLAEAVDEQTMAWLAEIKARPDPELSLAEQCDLPDWLVERLSANMTAGDLLALARGLNQPAPLDLRVNTLKTSREEVLAQLAAEGLEAERLPLRADGHSPEGQALAGPTSPLSRRQDRSAGRGQPVAWLPAGAEARRDGGRFLRRRRRQDPAARRADALHRPALRVRRGRKAAGQDEAAPGPGGSVERSSDAASAARTTSTSSAWRARSTACWSMRRARGWAPCGATPTSSGARRRSRWPN